MKGIISTLYPAGKLFILIGMLLLSLVIFPYFALYITDLFYPSADAFNLMQNISSFSEADAFTQTQVAALRLFQFLASAGQYFLMPLAFLYLCGENFFGFTGLNKKISSQTFIIILLIIICSFPLVSVLAEWNQAIHLPAAWSSLENSLRNLEENASLQQEAFLSDTSASILLINIFIIAISAAFVEEIFYRGLLQSFIQKIVPNLHVAVWLCAFIFSFMHFQFFGFIPRLLLGALLGYLFVWSGSLWASISAHFFNNFAGVMAYYYAAKNNIEPESLEHTSWYYALAALPAFIVFVFLYKRTVKTSSFSNGKRLDTDLLN